MRKTTKPLVILVMDPDMLEWKSVQELAAKGHTLLTYQNAYQIDLVIGRACAYMDDPLARYLPLTIRRAMERRYKGKVAMADLVGDVTLDPSPEGKELPDETNPD